MTRPLIFKSVQFTFYLYKYTVCLQGWVFFQKIFNDSLAVANTPRDKIFSKPLQESFHLSSPSDVTLKKFETPDSGQEIVELVVNKKKQNVFIYLIIDLVYDTFPTDHSRLFHVCHFTHISGFSIFLIV